MKPSSKVKSIIAAGLITMTGCAGYTYNGVTLNDLQDNPSQAIGGAMASAVTHLAGHMLSAEMMGEKASWNGQIEHIHTNDEEKINTFKNAGFAAQLAVGYAMKLSGHDSTFSRAFNTYTAAQLVSYPALNQDDVHNDFSGNNAIAYPVGIALVTPLITKSTSK